MEFLLKSGNLAEQKTTCLVVGVHARGDLSAPAAELDQASGGEISKLL